MRNFMVDPIADLVSDLKENVTTFFRQEVELAKKEISEKTSICVRSSVKLVAGGIIAYAGLIVILAGIGLIIGFAFERLGLNNTLAVFIGLGIAGLVAGAVGGLLVLQGIKAVSATPPVPKKTIDSLWRISDMNGHQSSKPRRTKERRSSDELYESAIETADRVQKDKEELAFRLSPRQLKKRTLQHMKEHSLMWSAAALGGAAVATGSILFGRKFSVRGARDFGIRAIKLLARRV
jgi:hypothetical protein